MVSVRTDLRAHGLFPRKGLGQHFLVDRNIINKVVDVAGLNGGDVVLEVGPGLGEMTAILADRAKRVIAVEIDPKLAKILKEKMCRYPNVEVIQEDILKIDLGRFQEVEPQRIKVVANLPYQISTSLLFRFIEAREIFSSLTLMLQKEVAERLVALHGRKEYGPLSIFVQMFSNVSIMFHVKPSAFFPPPKVESALIHMSWKGRPAVNVEDEEWFKKVVRRSMGYRRKTLINALKHSGLSLPDAFDERMKKAGIDPRRRSGTLTLQEFVRLAEILKG